MTDQRTGKSECNTLFMSRSPSGCIISDNDDDASKYPVKLYKRTPGCISRRNRWGQAAIAFALTVAREGERGHALAVLAHKLAASLLLVLAHQSLSAQLGSPPTNRKTCQRHQSTKVQGNEGHCQHRAAVGAGVGCMEHVAWSTEVP